MSTRAANQCTDLRELLRGFASGDVPALDVVGVENDSRCVEPGSLFLACPGEYRHGIEFVTQALKRGAGAIAWDACDPPAVDVPAVHVSRLAEHAGEIAARFHGHPSARLAVTAVTGTDGKTSCAHILAQAAAGLGQRCGYIGTLGYGQLDQLALASHTTPDAIRVQKLFAGFVRDGVDTIALEASSHALVQHRLSGVAVDVAVITNIGRDHLDYHGSQQAYQAAKRRLFDLPGLGVAVINADDPVARSWLGDLAPEVKPVVYGLNPAVARSDCRHVRARRVTATATGLLLDIETSWGDLRFETRLVGQFNACNVLAVLAVLLVQGNSPDACAAALSGVQTVPGRMEKISTDSSQPLVVVDFAHTPGALEAALRAIAEHVGGQLFCVFGCGGDRDSGKRPLMAAAAARQANAIWITDDNPRSEDPRAIVADILAGLADTSQVVVEHDRARAIAAAISAAAPGDGVLIAGKGHETCQVIGDQKHPFDDRQVAGRLLEAAA